MVVGGSPRRRGGYIKGGGIIAAFSYHLDATQHRHEGANNNKEIILFASDASCSDSDPDVKIKPVKVSIDARNLLEVLNGKYM